MLTLISLIPLFFISFSDIKYRRIPNSLLLSILIIGLFSTITSHRVFSHILGFFLPSLILLFLYMAKKLGAGDIKLFSALGLVWGYQLNIAAFVLSIFFSFFYSIAKHIFFRKSSENSLPFAPFILFAYLTLIVFGLLYQ